MRAPESNRTHKHNNATSRINKGQCLIHDEAKQNVVKKIKKPKGKTVTLIAERLSSSLRSKSHVRGINAHSPLFSPST